VKLAKEQEWQMKAKLQTIAMILLTGIVIAVWIGVATHG
jgi:hypothetical protein